VVLRYGSTVTNSQWGHQPDHTPGDNQNSGAYAFRPNGTTPYRVADGPVSVTVTKGAVSQEVVQVFANWITQTVRLYAGQPFVEIEWIVGPVPIDDNNVRADQCTWAGSLPCSRTARAYVAVRGSAKGEGARARLAKCVQPREVLQQCSVGAARCVVPRC
jgi:hypothetical protein